MSEIDCLVAGNMDGEKEFVEDTESDMPSEVLNETTRSYRLDRTQSMAAYYESQDATDGDNCCVSLENKCALLWFIN